MKKIFLKESPVHTWPIEELPDVPHVKGIDFYSKVMLTDEALRKTGIWLCGMSHGYILKQKLNFLKILIAFL